MSTPENAPLLHLLVHPRAHTKTWPLRTSASHLGGFIENRIIRATAMPIRIMPPIAIFTLCWQIALGGHRPRRAHALFAC